MTNEIVKQDAQEVQAVSGYEAFREQCAKTIELYDDATMSQGNYMLNAHECADIIRALPLPEVKQEPDGYRMRHSVLEKWIYGEHRENLWEVQELYVIPPDVEALRKENDAAIAEVLKLHRELAGEKLRADQGWARYESANRMLMSANVEIMQLNGGAA